MVFLRTILVPWQNEGIFAPGFNFLPTLLTYYSYYPIRRTVFLWKFPILWMPWFVMLTPQLRDRGQACTRLGFHTMLCASCITSHLNLLESLTWQDPSEDLGLWRKQGLTCHPWDLPKQMSQGKNERLEVQKSNASRYCWKKLLIITTCSVAKVASFMHRTLSDLYNILLAQRNIHDWLLTMFSALDSWVINCPAFLENNFLYTSMYPWSDFSKS